MEYYAAQFKNRRQLDSAMQNRLQEDDDIITGTLEELRNLHLKEGKLVYGVPAMLSTTKTSFITRLTKKILDKKTVFSTSKK